jgi:SAM-dependent methyltransferase
MRSMDASAGDVATASTLEFVRAHLPPADDRGRVLEVGCGSGALAARLQAAGYRVLAIDSSPHAVQAASAAGVPTRLAAWPEFQPDPLDDAPFDALLFTRSLHHIQPLDSALDRARELLVAGGRIIVEDFAFSEVDPRTAAWFFSILTLLDDTRVLTRVPEAFATRLLTDGGSYELWHAEGCHAITPASAIRAALSERFDLVLDASAPYLYRYVIPLLPADARGATLARRLHDIEWELAQAGLIQLIGRRFVGRLS